MSLLEDKLKELDNPQLRIRILNNLLQNDPHFGDINLLTNATEIEAKLKANLDFDKKRKLFEATSFDSESALKEVIIHLENMQRLPDFSPITKRVYDDISNRNDLPLSHYIDVIFDEYLTALYHLAGQLPEIHNLDSDFFFKFKVMEGVARIAEGVASAIKIVAWKRELLDFQARKLYDLNILINDAEEVTTPTDDFVRFENSAEKYLLLNDLGIIDFLNNKFAYLSNAKKSVMYAYITDTKSIKSFENILSQISNPSNKHYPFNESNKKKVSFIFDQIGISTQRTSATTSDKKNNQK